MPERRTFSALIMLWKTNLNNKASENWLCCFVLLSSD